MIGLAVNRAPAQDDVVPCLNFVIVGEQRSGASVLRNGLNDLAEVICHVGLLDESRSARLQAHQSYFDNDVAFASQIDTDSPYRYLNHQVFDNPQRGETRIGVHLPYERVRRWELDDLFHERYLEGDFCLLHVVRNPLACFVSQRQAEQSGIWEQPAAHSRRKIPQDAVQIEPAELIRFVRHNEAVRTRLRRAVPDLMEIDYEDLAYNYAATMRSVMEFLELEPRRQLRPSRSRRLHSESLRNRVRNWFVLERELPPDVLECLELDRLAVA